MPTTSTSPSWATNLVSDNEANAILRLGWEFNGNWFNWSVAQCDRRGELRRLLASDRDHHAGRARGEVQVPVEPQRPESPPRTRPTRPTPVTPTWTTSGPTSTTTSGERPSRPRPGLGPPPDPAVGPRLAGHLRRRAQQAHRHPRVVRRIPHRRSRPRRRSDRSSTTWPTGSSINDVAFASVWSYDSSADYRNNLSTAPSPRPWPSSRRTSADQPDAARQGRSSHARARYQLSKALMFPLAAEDASPRKGTW